MEIRSPFREDTEAGTANSYMRVAVLSTISSVSCEKTKYSPGERPTSSVTRRLAVSMSSTASIQTGVPRRSFLNISKGVARIEQPSFDRIQDWVLVGDASYDSFWLPASLFVQFSLICLTAKDLRASASVHSRAAVTANIPIVQPLRHFLHTYTDLWRCYNSPAKILIPFLHRGFHASPHPDSAGHCAGSVHLHSRTVR